MNLAGQLAIWAVINGADIAKFDSNGLSLSGGSVSTTISVKTANHTVAVSDNSLIFNCAGACTVTLPSAASFPGRIIWLRTIANQAVNSASSNVVPLAGGAAGTAILAATAGKWAILQSDGTNWQTELAN